MQSCLNEEESGLIFYLYSEQFDGPEKLDDLCRWLSEYFDQHFSPGIEVKLEEHPFTGMADAIRVYCEGSWVMKICFDPQTDDRYSGTRYFAKYLPLDDDQKSNMLRAESRYYVSIRAADPDYPEDCMDGMSALEKIPGATVLGPLEYHRKKMEAYPRQISRKAVEKHMGMIFNEVLEPLGFSHTRNLEYRRKEHEILEIIFVRPSDTETFYCTKASFRVYKSNGKVYHEILTAEGFNIWYIQPDGSNLVQTGEELTGILQGIQDSWFEF